MNKLQPVSQEGVLHSPVVEISRQEPARRHWDTPPLVPKSGGNGLTLRGAAPANAGSPPCVRGASADILAEALAAALRVVAGQGALGVADQSRRRGTEIVIVLFTDLVAWTQLSSHLTPDDSDELLYRHLSTLRTIVDACGGTEVKGLGDGTMVAFPSASTALSCAVEMQRAVDRENCRSVWPLGLRVGISGGEVTKENGDYYGDSVIEAARLCARASGGKILVTQVVRQLAGRRMRYRLRPLGELELKGLPETVATFEVDWEPSPRNPVPLSAISRLHP